MWLLIEAFRDEAQAEPFDGGSCLRRVKGLDPMVRVLPSYWVGLFKFHPFFRTQPSTSFLEPCCDVCFL